jgi:type IV secretory pathway VirB2 component (pilin)
MTIILSSSHSDALSSVMICWNIVVTTLNMFRGELGTCCWLFPREGWHSFLPLWWGRPVQLRAAEAAAVAVCCCIAPPLRIVLGWCSWKRTIFWNLIHTTHYHWQALSVKMHENILSLLWWTYSVNQPCDKFWMHITWNIPVVRKKVSNVTAEWLRRPTWDKGKIAPLLNWSPHHECACVFLMRAVNESVVSFTFLPIHPWETALGHWIEVLEGIRAGLNAVVIIIRALSWIELQAGWGTALK